MSDDDEPDIITKASFTAPTTRTLYRLTPTAIGDLTRSSRQIAIVAAHNEREARGMAVKADPFRQDWMDEKRFSSDALNTSENHVVGDVTFASRPVAIQSAPKWKPAR